MQINPTKILKDTILMSNRKIFISAILLFFNFIGYSQQAVIVSNTNNNSIEVKCFIQTGFSNNGINYYRTSDNGITWQKLNESPIYRGSQLPNANDFNNDNSLKDFIEITADINPTKDNGLIDLTILLKSVSSKPFAKYLGIMYEDFSISKGSEYIYKAAEILPSGNEKTIAQSEKIIADDYKQGMPPSDIQIFPFEKEIKISWKPEEERYFGVNVYRKNNYDENFSKINAFPILATRVKNNKGELQYPDFFFAEDSLRNNTIYYYKFEAIDYFGNLSLLSDVYEIVPIDNTPPTPPEKIKKITKNDLITFTWEYNGKEAILGFNLYRSTNDSIYTIVNKSIIGSDLREYSINEPVPGGYYYYFTSLDSARNEGLSGKIFVDVKDVVPPTPPINLSGFADIGIIKLNWQQNNESDLWGYYVYRKIKSQDKKEYVLLNSKPITDNSYIDTLASNIRNEFEYVVVAIDTSYNRSIFSDPVTVRLPDVTPPIQPYIKSVKKNEDNILIEWIPNVELDLAGYDLFRIQNTEKDTVVRKMNINIIKPNVSRFTDRDFEFNTGYSYFLVAIDSSDNASKPSAKFDFIYSGTTTTNAVFEKEKCSLKKNIVIVQWEFNSEELVGFVVFKKDKNNVFLPLTGLINTYSYKDSGIVLGSTYSYKIHAYLQNGNEIISKEINIVAK